MKEFMGEDFLLDNDASRELFKEADKMPIFDWHCHLSPKEIYENEFPSGITNLMLGADHYKWRAMRSYGIDEKLITGDAEDFEKFQAYAKTLEWAPGNPLYHWTNLELRRYFDITEPLSVENAKDVYDKANKLIAGGGFTPRELIGKSNVKCLFTTDDPCDTLEYHDLIKADSSFKTKVLPAFRPDKALGIELPTFPSWLKSLEHVTGKTIHSFEELKSALLERIEFFALKGCCGSDHAFSYVPCEEASDDELEKIFARGAAGDVISALDADKYKTALLRTLAKEYHRRNWVMELHIGPIRNNNSLMFSKLGADSGFDSIDDMQIARPLSRFLDSLEREGNLPKTVLFVLNAKDNYVIGSMLGNFQSSEAAGKIQFGSGWWFNDNLDGMREQMKALANLSVFGRFVGMVTDSRSFLSYPRHEYFRRILCGFIGDMVDKGLYPWNKDTLVNMVKDISFINAVNYFGVDI